MFRDPPIDLSREKCGYSSDTENTNQAQLPFGEIQRTTSIARLGETWSGVIVDDIYHREMKPD